MEEDVIDVAYIVGPPGVEHNEELRYSLRSVDKNLKGIGEVVIFGSAPKWTKARIVKTRAFPDKMRDARANLEAAVASVTISDPFWLFNDDFFVMKEMQKIPVVHRGEMVTNEKYSYQMKKAVEYLEKSKLDPPYLLYECHTPILVWKRVMKPILESTGTRALVKTIYMNLMGWPLNLDTFHGNAKVYPDTPRVWDDWPLLSTSNSSFSRSEVGHFIRETFPDPSRWEW